MKYFSNTLSKWYVAHGRHDLPWRQTKDAYRIWLSEIILQQTRVAQGWGYYLRFVERFPTVQALSEAEEDEVLSLWQGLGYYSRARNLLTAARQVMELGGFPKEYATVRALKGVGDYTAAAICSFAYNQPYAVVDGNVYRILTRYFGITTPVDSTHGKKEITALAQQLLEAEGVKASPCQHNSAMMDFGALQCTPQRPKCLACPLVASCYAYENNLVQSFPMKSKRVEVRSRYMVYVYILLPDGRTLLHRRQNQDIWAGLYEPFLLEFEHPPTDQDVMQLLAKTFDLSTTVLQKQWEGVKHLLTHRRLHIDFWMLRLGQSVTLDGFLEADEQQRDALASPRIVQQFYQRMQMENA